MMQILLYESRTAPAIVTTVLLRLSVVFAGCVDVHTLLERLDRTQAAQAAGTP
jgi:hypothetical protein